MNEEIMSGFNHFDLLAPLYERYSKPFDPTRICKIAGLPISGRLLDAGGGTGRVSHALRSWVKDIVIADSSLGMLTQAAKKSGLITVCSNTEELPFTNESFERVIMVDALHHVYDYKATIKELWRVLMPGGRIVIEEPDIDNWSVKMMAIIEKLVLMHSHFVSPVLISRLFQNPDANVHIEREGITSWIVAEKRFA